MKNQVTLKDNKWVWPIIDENSWEGQNQFTEMADKILPYVKNKNIMIQAGGNCGFLLSKFVEHFNTIYTFEPDPVNFYCLNQNVISPNVIKMQCCLGNNNNPVTTQQLIRPDRLHDTGGVHISGSGITPTIIIDNLKENFMSTCPNNGIEIQSWFGEDLDDNELLKLIPVLKTIVQNEEKDVRKVIKKYRDDLQQYAIDFMSIDLIK